MESKKWKEGLARELRERAVKDEPLSCHTTVRIGGPADLYIEALTSKELRDFVLLARRYAAPHVVLGGGSNVLASDAGFRGLVIANKARTFHFLPSTFTLWSESGALLPTLARECIEQGYANLEWAVGIPGTVGGAVVGNAGAHGGEIARDLIAATVLDAEGNVRDWTNQELEFGYRTSRLKGERWKVEGGKSVVLAATFQLRPGARAELEARAAELLARRQRRQPSGASMGSIFRNPPGDYAGRLLEAAGLKGTQIGQAQISPQHANFFINLGGATADDMKRLIDLARDRVYAQFGIELELEIELLER